MSSRQVLVKDLFKKETAQEVYMNLPVTLTAVGIQGKISGTFGKSGKLKMDLQ